MNRPKPTAEQFKAHYSPEAREARRAGIEASRAEEQSIRAEERELCARAVEAAGYKVAAWIVRNPDAGRPLHYCAGKGCPGYPWTPSGTMPHPCGRDVNPMAKR